jgi:colicin import membrane protein
MPPREYDDLSAAHDRIDNERRQGEQREAEDRRIRHEAERRQPEDQSRQEGEAARDNELAQRQEEESRRAAEEKQKQLDQEQKRREEIWQMEFGVERTPEHRARERQILEKGLNARDQGRDLDDLQRREAGNLRHQQRQAETLEARKQQFLAERSAQRGQARRQSREIDD